MLCVAGDGGEDASSSSAIGTINTRDKGGVVSCGCCFNENEWFGNCASPAVKARYTTVDTVGTLVGASLGIYKHGEC